VYLIEKFPSKGMETFIQ